jgi:hypothetical protein
VGGAGARIHTMYAATTLARPRSIYFAALQNGEQDNFFGPPILDQPLEQTLLVSDLVADGPCAASLEAIVQGATSAPHEVAITLNGTALGSVTLLAQES